MFSALFKSFRKANDQSEEKSYVPQPDQAYETYEMSYTVEDSSSGTSILRQAKLVLVGNIIYTDDHALSEILIEAQRYREFGSLGKDLSSLSEKILNQAEAIIITKPIQDDVSKDIFQHLIEGRKREILNIVNDGEVNFSPALGLLKPVNFVFSETTAPGKETRNTDIHTDKTPLKNKGRGAFVLVPLADKDKECGTILYTGPNSYDVAYLSEEKALKYKDHIQMTSVPIGHQVVLLTSTVRDGDGTFHSARQSIDGLRAVQNRFYDASSFTITDIKAREIDWNSGPEGMEVIVENAFETPYNSFEHIELPPHLDEIRQKALQERASTYWHYDELKASAA